MAICINLRVIPQHTHEHEMMLVDASNVLLLPGWCWAQSQQLATICSRSSLFNDIGSRKPPRSVVLAAPSGSMVSDHPRDAWSWHLAAHIRYGPCCSCRYGRCTLLLISVMVLAAHPGMVAHRAACTGYGPPYSCRQEQQGQYAIVAARSSTGRKLWAFRPSMQQHAGLRFVPPSRVCCA
jgi:hypothetical protein